MASFASLSMPLGVTATNYSTCVKFKKNGMRAPCGLAGYWRLFDTRVPTRASLLDGFEGTVCAHDS